MPRIPPHFLDVAFYLYPSVAAAKAASRSGGSGFLVSVAIEGSLIQVYAVTNRHVVGQGCCVLRLNTRDGGTECIETSAADWYFPDRDDLAVLPLDMSANHKWEAIGTEHFVTEQMATENTIGVGDAVFMVGRLVTREGLEQNDPIVRFGHVSMMRYTTSPADGGQECFLVECRSVSGFSGSAVLVQPGPNAVVAFGGAGLVLVPNPDQFEGVRLLGIDFCHIPLWKHVVALDMETRMGLMTDQNTGIAGVVPAWRLMNVLESEPLAALRANDLKKWRASIPTGVPDVYP